MGAIDIGIGHDDDFVIAEFLDIELILDRSAERSDQSSDLLRTDHFVETCFFDVQDFTTLLPFDAVRPILGI